MLTSPLDDSQISQVASLARDTRKLSRVTGYARLSGWIMLISGGLSVVFAMGSHATMALGLALAAMGLREISLARRLSQLDIRAPGLLALNQVVLAVALAAYALYTILNAPEQSTLASGALSDPMLAQSPELNGMTQDLEQLEKTARTAISVTMLVFAIVVPGITALVYKSKRKTIKQIHARTPAWTLRVHAAATTGHDPYADDLKRAA